MLVLPKSIQPLNILQSILMVENHAAFVGHPSRSIAHMTGIPSMQEAGVAVVIQAKDSRTLRLE